MRAARLEPRLIPTMDEMMDVFFCASGDFTESVRAVLAAVGVKIEESLEKGDN